VARQGQQVLPESGDPSHNLSNTAAEASRLDASCKGKDNANGSPRGRCNGKDSVKTQKEHQVDYPRAKKREEGDGNVRGLQRLQQNPELCMSVRLEAPCAVSKRDRMTHRVCHQPARYRDTYKNVEDDDHKQGGAADLWS
jgi:hypothetical protein